MIEGCTHLGVHGPQVENLCNMYVYVEHNFSLEWGGEFQRRPKTQNTVTPNLVLVLGPTKPVRPHDGS